MFLLDEIPTDIQPSEPDATPMFMLFAVALSAVALTIFIVLLRKHRAEEAQSKDQ